jgi:peptidoglycan hydrolase-like protein with peptidoglycan-binding domain
MSNAEAMIKAARASLGIGEPNAIQQWYRGRNGSAYNGNFPWCDAAITYWAYHSGNHKEVCPHGDRAYTPDHVQDFKRINRWHAGQGADARPGDIVFFDNPGGAFVDHVGLVERNEGGGVLITIEGNTSNQCRRLTRRAGSGIIGYGRPAYDATSTNPPAPPAPRPLVVDGQLGPETYKAMQRVLGVTVDGVFGPNTKRALQKHLGVAVDGVIGPVTIKALQARVGAVQDGQWGPNTTRALQVALNAGRF